MRILLIDDDEVSLLLIEMYLSSIGHDVWSFQKPLEAIDLIKYTKFDAVVTDYVMFDITGLELIAKIRKFDNTPKFILCSEILHDEHENTSNICKNLNISFINKDMCSPQFKENIKSLLE